MSDGYKMIGTFFKAKITRLKPGKFITEIIKVLASLVFF